MVPPCDLAPWSAQSGMLVIMHGERQTAGTILAARNAIAADGLNRDWDSRLLPCDAMSDEGLRRNLVTVTTGRHLIFRRWRKTGSRISMSSEMFLHSNTKPGYLLIRALWIVVQI
jgi:hypothetical protein